MADSLTAGQTMSKVDFLRRGDIVDSLRMGWKVPEPRERLTMLVIVGMSTEEHFFEKPSGWQCCDFTLNSSSSLITKKLQKFLLHTVIILDGSIRPNFNSSVIVISLTKDFNTFMTVKIPVQNKTKTKTKTLKMSSEFSDTCQDF